LGGNIRIDIKGHGFGFQPGLGGIQVVGTINSIEVDVNGSVAYKLTGVSTDVHTLAVDIKNHNFVGALNLLLKGNDTIVDANTGPTTLAGGPGDDTFVLGAGAGQVTIWDFNPGTLAHHDKLNLHAWPGLASLHDVKTTASFDSHHNVVIHDTMGDSVTLHNVKSLGLLHGYDFHF
jgi:hypothetical protein